MPEYSLASSLFLYNKNGDNIGDPIEAIQSISAAGFTQTELMAEGIDWINGPPDPKPILNALESNQVFPHSIHAPYTDVNLASLDENERQIGIEKVTAAIRFLGEVGGTTIIVHPTMSSANIHTPLYTLQNVGRSTEAAHRSISKLISVAEVEGVRIALENLPAKNMTVRPLETMKELRAFMSDLSPDFVGICHDIGHSRLNKLDIADEARIASDRLYALHIQDGFTQEDDHLPPGHGTLDFESYGKALKEIQFDGAWTLEVLSKNHPGTLEDITLELSRIKTSWTNNGMTNLNIT